MTDQLKPELSGQYDRDFQLWHQLTFVWLDWGITILSQVISE